MPKFKDREEYERWKTERLKKIQERGKEQKEHEEDTVKASPFLKAETIKTDGKLTGIGELFSNSWQIYKNRIGTLIALYLFSAISCVVSLGIFIGTGFLLSHFLSESKIPLILSIVIGITIGFIALFWGMAAFTFAVADESIGIKDALEKGWQRVSAFIWLFTIMGFIITGGFLLFLVPGVIFLVWFTFAQFILAVDDERGMNALLKSKEYVKGYWFDVFLRLLVIWLVSMFIGMVPFLGGILSLFFVPFMMIFIYLIYKNLKVAKGDIVYSSSSGEKFKWIGAGTLGYVVLPLILIAFLGATFTIPLLFLKGILKSSGH